MDVANRAEGRQVSSALSEGEEECFVGGTRREEERVSDFKARLLREKLESTVSKRVRKKKSS